MKILFCRTVRYLALILAFPPTSAEATWIRDGYQWLPSNPEQTIVEDTVAEKQNWSPTAIDVWSYDVSVSSHYIVVGDSEQGPSWSLKVQTLQNQNTEVPISGTYQIPPMSGALLKVKFYRESGWERWKRTLNDETTYVMRSLSANQYLEHWVDEWNIVSEGGGSGAGN
jgi:hypothetical protein